MSTHVSIRLLIGLSKPGETAEETTCALGHRRSRVHELVGHAFDVGNITYGTGYWKRQTEPSITFETIQEDTEENRAVARGLAAYIREALGQEAVGLVFAPVTFELI